MPIVQGNRPDLTDPSRMAMYCALRYRHSTSRRPFRKGLGMQGNSESTVAAAPMNVEEMRRQLGDDDALVAEVIQLFLDDCPVRMAALATAIDARDAATVRRAAHAIKGGASNFFASGVVKAAAALEMLAAGGDLTGVDELAARLDTEMRRLVAAMTELRSAQRR